MMDWSLQSTDLPAPSAAPRGAGGDAIRLTTPSAEALLADLERRLAAGRGFSVATLNLDHVVKLRRDGAFRRAYAAHSHVVADGNPVVWLSRLSGQPMRLAPGSDLVDPVMALAARAGAPVAFLGGDEAALERAAERLGARHPGLRVALRLAPSMGFDPEGPEAGAAIDALAASDARICLLALGAPRQEILASRIAARLPVMGVLSVGAGLDFVAGRQRRAPRAVRALKAEWLWRLASDPRRLAGRYADCALVLPALGRAALRSRRRGAGTPDTRRQSP